MIPSLRPFAPLVFSALLAGLGIATPASAQSARLLGEFRDWSSFSASEGAGAMCFMMSRPTETTPLPDGMGEAYLYLTNRSSEGVRNEFNLVAGFPLAPDAGATVSVGGQIFDLFTERDAAWLLDPSQGDNLAGAIRAGSSLVVDATSERGIKIRQTYSLSGATAASRALDGC
ncbi:MAG: invasion associated locus B family protein [Devosia sp.]